MRGGPYSSPLQCMQSERGTNLQTINEFVSIQSTICVISVMYWNCLGQLAPTTKQQHTKSNSIIYVTLVKSVWTVYKKKSHWMLSLKRIAVSTFTPGRMGWDGNGHVLQVVMSVQAKYVFVFYFFLNIFTTLSLIAGNTRSQYAASIIVTLLKSEIIGWDHLLGHVLSSIQVQLCLFRLVLLKCLHHSLSLQVA